MVARSRQKGKDCPKCETAALEYIERGWSVIPTTEKRAAAGWKEFQKRRMTQAELHQAFAGATYNVAVVLGEVSGDLGVRDFDKDGSYARWAAKHQELADGLPTVATGRRGGHHVYFKLAPDVLRALRREFGTTGHGAMNLGDGELRCDVGCYVVAPPSIHPNGRKYKWTVPLGDEVPLVDPREAGLLDCWAKSQDSTTEGRAIDRVDGVYRSGDSVHSVYPDVSVAVEQAIAKTQPTGVGHRRACLFQFARALKAIPELAERQAADLLSYVKQWHTTALPRIGTKEFEETKWDFYNAWEDVMFPAGAKVVDECFRVARTSPFPACAAQYEGERVRLLVAGCWQLQKIHGDHPFFVSCREAGRVLGVDHHTANNWLRGITADGVLRVVGKPACKAFRYRFVGQV